MNKLEDTINLGFVEKLFEKVAKKFEIHRYLEKWKKEILDFFSDDSFVSNGKECFKFSFIKFRSFDLLLLTHYRKMFL
jgi:hypothetical protein